MFVKKMSCGRNTEDKRDYPDAPNYSVEKVKVEGVSLSGYVAAFNADDTVVKLDDDQCGDERARYHDDDFSGSLPKLISCHS